MSSADRNLAPAAFSHGLPSAISRLLAIAAIASLFAVPAGGAEREESVRQAAFQPVGHRGLCRHAPENSLAGFVACIDLKIGFEVDVRRSRDGRLVCVHDDTLNRTTNGFGKVSDYSLEELRRLDAGRWFDPAFAGERIPTLEEVFDLVRKRQSSRVLVAIDFKADDDAVEADVVRLAVQYGIVDRLLCIGRAISMPEVRARLRAADRRVPVAAVANTADELPAAIADRNADWVYVRFVLSREQADRVHQAGKRVIVAGPTVVGNETENWSRVIGAGADSVLTDYPLESREIARKVSGSAK